MLEKYAHKDCYAILMQKIHKKIQKYNSNLLYIPDHPHRILMIGGSGSGKSNGLLNPINHQSDVDKIYLHAKDPFEAKYQFKA